MSWWNKRSRERDNKIVRFPRLDERVPKINDSQCVACYLKNDSAVELTFVSQLEKYYPQLIEAPAFLEFKLKPNEKKLVPHTYFDILPHEIERKITRIGIDQDHEPVEFLYKVREPISGTGGEVDHSQAANHDTTT